MDNITVFNLKHVNKGVLKATVSINLGQGITIHECKIVNQDDNLKASPPQRTERIKGGGVIYHDFIEFEQKDTWNQIESQILNYYRSQV